MQKRDDDDDNDDDDNDNDDDERRKNQQFAIDFVHNRMTTLDWPSKLKKKQMRIS